MQSGHFVCKFRLGDRRRMKLNCQNDKFFLDFQICGYSQQMWSMIYDYQCGSYKNKLDKIWKIFISIKYTGSNSWPDSLQCMRYTVCHLWQFESFINEGMSMKSKKKYLSDSSISAYSFTTGLYFLWLCSLTKTKPTKKMMKFQLFLVNLNINKSFHTTSFIPNTSKQFWHVRVCSIFNIS